jgi:phosphatidylinositol alpha 1,6-mannosyltransferase
VTDSAPRPLRIALFTGNYVHIEDGVSRTLGRLVGYLVGRGHDVRVFGPTVARLGVVQPGTFVPVPSVPIPGRPEYRFSLGFPRRLRREVEAFAPDLVHLATPDVLGHRALTWARRRGVPAVATYHTHFASYLAYYGLARAEPVFRAIGRHFYNRCTEVYVPTPAMEADLRAHGITVLMRLWPRGIELDRFSPDGRSEPWRASLGFGPSDVVVSFVSRLVKEKGPDVFTDVVTRLAGEGLPVRALVVGDGPEREAMEAALPDAVFTGHLGGADLAIAYASSDVFLFPSETETFGNVTLEAMASGLPTVCADAAGSRSLVEHETTGLLCPPRDVEAFTDAARRLVNDPELRARFGMAGRHNARAYSWPAVLQRMETFYEGVLAGENGRLPE